MLEQYVVYNSPKDYPNKYVVRRFLIGNGTLEPKEVVAISESKNEVLKHIPGDRVKIDRHENDDPVIEEVWI